MASTAEPGSRSGARGLCVVALAAMLSCLPLRGAQGQGVTEQVEKDFVGSWLVVVGGEARSRVLAIREVAARADGSYLLDAKYGWTIGRPTAPVGAELYGAPGSYRLSVSTNTGSVIVSKQTGPGAFAGTFTFASGRRTADVEIRKASAEEVRARVAREIEESGRGDGFALENKDWGIAPTATPRTDRPHAPTPRSIEGVRTVTTLQLYHWLLNDANPPVLVDVLDGRHESIRGAHWLPKGGTSGGRADELKFAAALEKLTGGDKSKPVAFFCLSSECWLSYNAALRARALGYTAVAWYRGGTDAWRAADFPRERMSREAW